MTTQDARYTGKNHTRDEVEADELRRLAYSRCGLDTSAVHADTALSRRPRALFYERAENRQVSNAPDLCSQLSKDWDAWLFEEPADLDFCAQVQASQWADVAVLNFGCQVQYFGFFGRRGAVMIVTYSYPLLAQKVTAKELA